KKIEIPPLSKGGSGGIFATAFFLTAFSILFFGDVSFARDAAEIEKAVQTEKNPLKLPRLYKELGDVLFASGNNKEAATAYVKALSFPKRDFSGEERRLMAMRIAWAGDFKKAESELFLILSEDPKNSDARVSLSRVISWQGRMDEALVEAEKVIKLSPGNAEALVVKADVLRWKGDFAGAVSLYEEALKKGENFSARLGLSYALLYSGKKTEALENASLLRPGNPSEEGEAVKLREAIEAATKPGVKASSSGYSDSDGNRVDYYSIGYGFFIRQLKTDLSYKRVDASDDLRTGNADTFYVSVSSDARVLVFDSINAGAGFSALSPDAEDSTEIGIYHVGGKARFTDAGAGIYVSKFVLTDTARLIEEGVRVLSAGLDGSYKAGTKFSVLGSYGHGDYSDDNSSDEVNVVPEYEFVKAGAYSMKAGYKFKYLDFKRNSGSGYFDPQDFISHQVFLKMFFEKERHSLSLEPFIGNQSFERYGKGNNDPTSGVSGRYEYKISRSAVFSLRAETGDYAAGTAAGFRFTQFGAGVEFRQ
ncbi:MAG: tetratricopeptide repeat protein, partial [Thermodesulfobacteriota bacterium]